MDNKTIVANLIKISTLLADESDYELWIAPTLQEAIDQLEPVKVIKTNSFDKVSDYKGMCDDCYQHSWLCPDCDKCEECCRECDDVSNCEWLEKEDN